jgi:hypothetical protein
VAAENQGESIADNPKSDAEMNGGFIRETKRPTGTPPFGPPPIKAVTLGGIIDLAGATGLDDSTDTGN